MSDGANCLAILASYETNATVIHEYAESFSARTHFLFISFRKTDSDLPKIRWCELPDVRYDNSKEVSAYIEHYGSLVGVFALWRR